jgi:hypothetical protein
VTNSHLSGDGFTPLGDGFIPLSDGFTPLSEGISHVVNRSVLTAEEDEKLAELMEKYFKGFHSLKPEEFKFLRRELKSVISSANEKQVRTPCQINNVCAQSNDVLLRYAMKPTSIASLPIVG